MFSWKKVRLVFTFASVGLLSLLSAPTEAGRSVRSDSSDTAFEALGGFWGDTLYQSERRLRRYYATHGLELVEARPSPGFAGAPVFIYHVLRRT